MNVLFWINNFPAFSETFIRDQIVNILDNNIEVYIISSRKKDFSQKNALNGFEKYKLLDRYIDRFTILPVTWRKRKLRLYTILVVSLFNGNYKYYKRALKIKRHKAFPKAYELFFNVHLLLKKRINIIHTHYGPNGNQAAVFKELGLPIKLICTFHGYDIRLGLKEAKDYYNPLFHCADKIIAISDFNRRELIKFGLDSTKIIDLPNGIDTAFFKRGKSADLTDQISILTVARLEFEKALDTGIRAVAAHLKKYPEPNLKYTIIGGGSLEEELQNLINDLNVASHIEMVGVENTKAVRDAMASADIYLMTSKDEVLPTVLLEAQACELPIIATDVGSIKEMLADGIIVKPNSVDELLSGLKTMIENRHKWSQMGRAGRNFVKEQFEIKKITKKLIDIYNE